MLVGQQLLDEGPGPGRPSHEFLGEPLEGWRQDHGAPRQALCEALGGRELDHRQVAPDVYRGRQHGVPQLLAPRGAVPPRLERGLVADEGRRRILRQDLVAVQLDMFHDREAVELLAMWCGALIDEKHLLGAVQAQKGFETVCDQCRQLVENPCGSDARGRVADEQVADRDAHNGEHLLLDRAVNNRRFILGIASLHHVLRAKCGEQDAHVGEVD
mmetsp:Transcript_31517/g.95265  ORF Transcript_31517/g.95265 Transcript_31517/m.95265 type:complete len:215 (-) Transcript_31517:52-696(-)